MSANNIEGPTVLWGELKGKKVKSNDGKDLGDIDKISQNYIKLEKGTIKKEKFWVPKYLADAFDGKVLWLLIGEDETRAKFQYGEEPSCRDNTKMILVRSKLLTVRNRTWDADKVSVTPERTIGVSTKPADSNEDYKNVRDLK